MALFYFNCKVLDSNMYIYDREIRNSFSIVEDVFDKVSTKHYFDNYNHYVFKSFRLISKELQSVIVSLKNLYKTKSVPSLIFQLDYLLDNLININNNINNYGVKTASEITDIDRYEDVSNAFYKVYKAFLWSKNCLQLPFCVFYVFCVLLQYLAYNIFYTILLQHA